MSFGSNDKLVRRGVVLCLGLLLLGSAFVVGKTLYSILWPAPPPEVTAEVEEVEDLAEPVVGGRAPASRPAPIGGGSRESSGFVAEREGGDANPSSELLDWSTTEDVTTAIQRFFSSSQNETSEVKSTAKQEEEKKFSGGFGFGSSPIGGPVVVTTTTTHSDSGSSDSGGGGSGSTPTVNVQPPFFSSVTNGGFATGTTGGGFHVTATVGDPLSLVSGPTSSGNYKVLFNSSAQR